MAYMPKKSYICTEKDKDNDGWPKHGQSELFYTIPFF